MRDLKSGEDTKIAEIKRKINIQRMNLPARASLFMTATNLLCKGAAFAFTTVFTRLLTTSEYGEFSLFSTYLSLVIALVSLELSGGVIIRAFQRWRGLQHLTIIGAWLMSVALSVPVVLALFLIKSFGGNGLSFPLAYAFLFVSVISLTLINLYVSCCKFIYNWQCPLAVSVSQSILAPLLSIVLLRATPFHSINHVSAKVGTISIVLGLSAIIICVLSLRHARREVRALDLTKENPIEQIKRSNIFLLRLALPLLPYYFSVIAISQSDKLFISNILGNEALAKYSVAYSAGIALTAVTGGIMGALTPWIMRKVRAGEINRIRELLNTMTSLFVPIIMIFLSLAPFVLDVLAPKEYTDSLPVLFVSAIIPMPLAISQCMSSIAIAHERVGGVVLSGLVPASSAILLNALFTKSGSIIIPAIITASSYTLLMILGVANVSRISKSSPINVNNTFQKFIFLYFGSAVLFVFKDIFIVRSVVITISIICVLRLSKSVLSLLSEKNPEQAQTSTILNTDSQCQPKSN